MPIRAHGRHEAVRRALRSARVATVAARGSANSLGATTVRLDSVAAIVVGDWLVVAHATAPTFAAVLAVDTAARTADISPGLGAAVDAGTIVTRIRVR